MTDEERGVPWYTARLYAATQRDLLAAVDGLSESQLRDRPGRTNSIAFDLWHLGRWADHLGSILSEMTPRSRSASASCLRSGPLSGSLRNGASPPVASVTSTRA